MYIGKLLSCYAILLLTCCFFPGTVFSAVVTLDSIEIFKTHEWLVGKPTVYFNCKGENKIDLPDVKKTHVSYTFKGEESWQPLTNFSDKKCKRCGFYEKDILKADEFDEWEFCPSSKAAGNSNLLPLTNFSDKKCKRCGFYEKDILKADEFDEWEFCPSDFIDGRYSHFKEKEFNATFLCLECKTPPQNEASNASGSHKKGNNKHLAVIVTFSVLGSILFILILVAAYKYWRKRKREKDHARFLKLFEEEDDIEDELGLGPLDGVM